MPFPAGQWTGYFQWAVKIGGHKLFLNELPLVVCKSMEDKEAKERSAAPENVIIIGEKKKVKEDDTARGSARWDTGAKASAGTAFADCDAGARASAEKPFLDMIKAMDLTGLSRDDPAAMYKVTSTVGYKSQRSRTDEETVTTEIHSEVKGVLGFSEISSVEANFGGSVSKSSRKSITTSAEFSKSTTSAVHMPFPAGQWTGYFQWAVKIGGHKLFLNELPLVVCKSMEDKEAKERSAAPENVIIIGEKKKVKEDDTARGSARWDTGAKASAGTAFADCDAGARASAEIGSEGAKAGADFSASAGAGWEGTPLQVRASAGPKVNASLKLDEVGVGGELASARAGKKCDEHSQDSQTKRRHRFI